MASASLELEAGMGQRMDNAGNSASHMPVLSAVMGPIATHLLHCISICDLSLSALGLRTKPLYSFS